jgi:FtsZ-interacting cell division protein YlmF
MTTKDLGKAFQSLTDAQAQRVSDFLVGEAENMNSGSPRPNNFFVNTPDIWQAYKAMRGMKENLKRKK